MNYVDANGTVLTQWLVDVARSLGVRQIINVQPTNLASPLVVRWIN